MSTLKSDVINEAYAELRISGITVQPSASDNAIALLRLEQMANEYAARNICVGYNFEDTPDVNSTSGIPAQFQYSFAICLANRLQSAFGKGKEPDPILLRNAGGQLSFLHAQTENTQQINYSSRQSLGAGNTLNWNRYQRFYPETINAPAGCETNRMVIGDTDNFVEHFDAYLVDSEVISSYVITADTGLTINSDSNATPDIKYQIEAGGTSDAFLQVKIVVTTDGGRVTTRLIDFELTKIRILS